MTSRLEDFQASLQEAKRRLRIPELWAKLGLENPPSSGRARVVCSPFRPERSPSFSISADGMLWKDFSGEAAGDAVTFIEHACNLSRKDAMRHLMELAGVVLPAPGESPRPLALVAPQGATAEPLRRRAMPDLDGLTEGTREQWARLAVLRGVSVAAVERMVARGGLLFGDYRNLESWVVTDSRRCNAQARRLDGKCWPVGGGGVKAMTVPNSWGAWPLGAADAGPNILLCEGGPDWLAGFELSVTVWRDVSPVTMLGASMPIYESALGWWLGKKVWIVPHGDDAGGKALAKWSAQLAGAGIVPRVLRLPDGVKDLNDFVRLPAPRPALRCVKMRVGA